MPGKPRSAHDFVTGTLPRESLAEMLRGPYAQKPAGAVVEPEDVEPEVVQPVDVEEPVADQLADAQPEPVAAE